MDRKMRIEPMVAHQIKKYGLARLSIIPAIRGE
jgi:hypothetical protein